MTPAELDPDRFHSYPAKGRQFAIDQIDLLRTLPLAFTPFLLKEIISFDWKFPVEQRDLTNQLRYVAALTAEQRRKEMAVFAGLQLSTELQNFDWINSPGQFLEKLSAHLWATHQMDAFRKASEEYMGQFYASLPSEKLSASRLGIVAIGQGVDTTEYRLFRKLRPQGMHFSKVRDNEGLHAILEAVRARANAHPAPYGHWYIDGGAAVAFASSEITVTSYDALAPARRILSAKMLRSFESPTFGAEALRTMLAQLGPHDAGLENASDPTLARFQLSLLTEGSGTQVYSTTFVQWAAREAYRRAQPLTLFARFSPRLRERPMNELLTSETQRILSDPHGSLIDADMGAYYTWLNQQRLSGGAQSAFLVWFENHGQAVAVGPSMPRGKQEASEIGMRDLLAKLSA